MMISQKHGGPQSRTSATQLEIPMANTASVALIRMVDPVEASNQGVQEKMSSKQLVPMGNHVKPERKVSEYQILKELKKKQPDHETAKQRMKEHILGNKSPSPENLRKAEQEAEYKKKYNFTKKSYAQFANRKELITKNSTSTES